MSEFIGSRISLVSRSDIRYVGTLHEINSEESTVALEQVVSYGTEGRRNNAADEIAPSSTVYDYIVFRGSDVKDLRIEEPPKEQKPQPPPQVPNDPAILGSGPRSNQVPQAPQSNQGQPPQNQQDRGPPQPPPGQQYPPFYQGTPGGQPFGGPPGGPPPPGPGFPQMPFGSPPPGWFPPPQHGFPPHPGQFPGQLPYGPPGHHFPPPQQQQTPRDQGQKGPQVAPTGPTGPRAKSGQTDLKEVKPAAPAGQPQASAPPPPPNESKPDVATALAPAQPQSSAPQQAPPTGPKSNRIMPAVPLAAPNAKAAGGANGVQRKPDAGKPQKQGNGALDSATQAATAAVAAAMAKLPPAPGKGPSANNKQQQQQNASNVDNLTQKVNEMRTNEGVRNSRQPGTGGFATGRRTGRGRGGNNNAAGRKVEVPTTDFDFASANAKFNKQDLIKEAIATGSPAGTPDDEQPSKNGLDSVDKAADTSKDGDNVVIPPPAPYNRTTSFFDNISSESKDREDADGKRPGGREWRGEEQKKNVETFGQSNVDSGYRGYRGRGRGRGGTGYSGRGGRGFRGGRGANGSFAPRGGSGAPAARGGGGPATASAVT